MSSILNEETSIQARQVDQSETSRPPSEVFGYSIVPNEATRQQTVVG